MRVYHERLHAPAAWWLLCLLSVAILGAELFAGFGWLLAAVVYGSMIAVCAGALLAWGRVRVEVTDGQVRAGGTWLPLSAAGQVSALDEAQTRAIRGPRADPAAFLLIRPYLSRAVYIEVTDPRLGVPYWLIGTRRAAELASAVEKARRPHADGAAVG